MSELTAYELQNKIRDLNNALNTVIQQQPNFLSLFTPGEDATNTKHEWNENTLAPRTFMISSASSGSPTEYIISSTAEEMEKIEKGFHVQIDGSVTPWRVVSIDTETTATIEALQLFDDKKPEAQSVFKIIGKPQKEGSTTSDGESKLYKNGNNYNFTEIFRKEIIMTGSAIASNAYGSFDNNLSKQTEAKILEMTRDLNAQLFTGVRTESTASTGGQYGGMFYFSSLDGALKIASTGTPKLSSTLVNDGAEEILASGGNPNTILCSVGQARNLSEEFKGQIQVTFEDKSTGQYVAQIKNDVTGAPMVIMSDYQLPDSFAYVCDNSGFERNDFRSLTDKDSTSEGFDGIARTLLLETTFSLINFNQKNCQLGGLGMV